MVRCPRDFRAICTAVAPDAVGTLRIYNPTPPVYDGHLVPCSSDHNRAIMPNCELQPRELLKNVPTRVGSYENIQCVTVRLNGTNDRKFASIYNNDPMVDDAL